MDMKPRVIRMSLAVALVFAVASYIAAGRCAAQHQHAAPGNVAPRVVGPRPVAAPQPARENVPAIDVKRLSAIQEAVARAVGHLQAGHQQEALTELKLVQNSLESLRRAIERNTALSFVNDRCPIMGTLIDPTKVPAALTRMHEGRRVAFCCAGCPQAWDRLGTAEKAAKLANVMTPAAQQGTRPMNMADPSHQQGMQHMH
jgi:hypothetical protein